MGPMESQSSTFRCTSLHGIIRLLFQLNHAHHNTHRNAVLLVFRQWTAVDVVAYTVAPDAAWFENTSRRWAYDRSDVGSASILVVNHTEDVHPLTSEMIHWRCDTDQANNVVRLVVDKEGRVNVEDEQWWTAEVIPVSVVDRPTTSLVIGRFRRPLSRVEDRGRNRPVVVT